MVAGGALLALLVGLLAGVGARYARQEVPVPLAGRLPAWACGVMAALATAGIAAALAALVPRVAPELAGPEADGRRMAAGGCRALRPLADSGASPSPCYLLSLIDRATEGWTRRLPLVALALVVIGVAASVLAGHEPWQAIPHGAIEGATAFAFAWLLLRYDLRAVPAFVATGLVLEALRAAFLAATPSGWLSFGVSRRGGRPVDVVDHAIHGKRTRAGQCGKRKRLSKAVGWHGALLSRERSDLVIRALPMILLRGKRSAAQSSRAETTGANRAAAAQPCRSRDLAHVLFYCRPIRNDVVVGEVRNADVASRRPRNHLPVQRNQVDFRV